ncbi:hypothetical protein C0J52_22054 [Blattella germanica]|nr:hypothetical protein C0J52_22054 [Blattella germanica]
MKVKISPLRLRGGGVLGIGLTLMFVFFSYAILQGAINVGRLLNMATIIKAPPDAISDIDSFLVWSPKCQIPNVSPFHESIRQFIVRRDPIVCSNKTPLTYTATVLNKNFLFINESVLHQYSTRPKDVNCCFSIVTRVNTPEGKVYNKTADDYFNVSTCKKFDRKVELGVDEEFVLVKCQEDTKNKDIYANMHAVVQLKESVKNKLTEHSLKKKRLSVLIFGLDSISRLNLKRTMPKTVAYLHRNGWLEFQGYNKVGENTLPNLSAIFMGLNEEQLKKVCWKSRHKKFDDCPLIWKHFSNLSYITGYLEDTPTQSTFNYHKTGFVKPPTDYYLRPMMLAAEKLLPVKIRDFLNVCLGPTQTSEHILEYVTDFATIFNRALYFLVAWINNFSHSDSALPATMDKRILEFFQKLERTGALNSTLVIFLSDHGIRWGDIRSTSVGWLEERLPFLYIWVPDWFKSKYPDMYKNMKTNTNRLTSPFDVHVTLKDIIRISNGNTSLVQGCQGCPNCTSLFSEVPSERGCEEAGITPNWCTCTKYRTMTTKGKIVKEIVLFVISDINSKIRYLSNGTSVCSELAFDQVLQLKRKVAPYHDDYIVVFDTLPGGAVFEATVGRTGKTGAFEMRGSVSRINSYANRTECVDDPELKLYCHCT